MGVKIHSKSILVLTLILLILVVINCTKHTLNSDEKNGIASCEGCHTNYSHLQEVYSPDTAAAVGGCGGDAPHYEPYDRVYMDPEDLDSYSKSSHYSIGCTGCHNGTDNTADKEIAHSGEFISHPSLFYEEKCGSCHSEIVENFKTSLHHGTGQKRKVTLRSGLNGPEDFDKLPAHQIEGYNSNCATCHGTCGNCHIVRPPIGGGGLINSHEFIKTPDMVSVCVTCHTSRGGHAYLGVAAGTKPDIHLTNMGYRCIDCHDAGELHGDGQPVEQRYAYDKLPTCEKCHIGIESKNSYHGMHYNDFNCQVCHSQVYNNCGSCHIHGEGARVPSYLDFKIGANPIPDIKDQYDFVLIRRTLAAPDNWKEYGVEEYDAFDELPTYNYTSPHNLLRWTERTQVADGSSCYSNCHIRKEADTLVNKKLYLFKEDLLDWEFDATEYVTVDGKLPESWTN
ncbi:hypothetical protein ACFLTE_04515 [Bacteroidota bacterium]